MEGIIDLILSGTLHYSSAMAKAVPRTVLITGCSSGIGLCMAVQLARDPGRRFHVIATMRDLRKKDKLEVAAGDTLNQTLTIRRLDVCSDESVAECINSLPEKQLDVLVNNAGVGLIGPLETISIDAMKHIFETNFFGAVRMIKAVLPAMKQHQKGHIVVISSVMGLQGIPFNDVYAASKFAIEGFCESLAVQLLKFNIFISLVEPGPINTEFEMKLMEEVAKSQFPGVDAATVHSFKDIYLPASHEIFTTMGQSPEFVAKVGAVPQGPPNLSTLRLVDFNSQNSSACLQTPILSCLSNSVGIIQSRMHPLPVIFIGSSFSLPILICLPCYASSIP
uniref:Ketoreductase domain-containing protein n=1 Tax=Pseudonaja textilis TaxID=8673 RepID=A0A670YX79_PSETE